MNKIESRRMSTNSESSIEPMDISSSNKTLSSEANSSLAIKTSDHHESDSPIESAEDIESESPIRRDNLRNHMDTKMLRKKFRSGSFKNNAKSGTKTTANICPICNIAMSTQHDLTEHIREHNMDGNQHYKCRICSKVLSSASSLDRHILVHSGERPFTCKFCHVTFTTNGNMHRHMRLHKQQGLEVGYEDSDDGGNAGSSTDETSSISSGDVNTTTNQSMNNNNNNNIKRKNNEDNNDTSNVKRKIKTTINNNNIINKLLTAPLPSEHQQKFCCPVCDRNDFINMVSLEHHMDREHPSIQAKCRHCDQIFKSHKALNAHRCVKSNQSVTQGFNDLTFVDFTSEKFPIIAKSMCEQSIRTPVTPQKYECPKCYRAFPCSTSVNIHIKECGEMAHDFSLRRRNRSSRSISSDEEDDDGGDMKNRDDFFANLNLQNKSLSNNSSPRSMQSDSCKTDLADIQSIINVTSSGGMLCQLDSKSSNEYIPIKEEEEVQDAFTAEFRKMKLRGEFPCKLCTAVFPNLRALKGHNRVHLSAAGAGPYRCNMCPYSIHDKAALIRHMRTHNGDRPYECAVCNYAFTTKANCERHLKNRHAKTTRDEVKRAIIYHPSEDSTADEQQHNKKRSIYGGSPDMDDEDNLPKDRSTPVSHLKELLIPSHEKEPSPIKIQVKSLEKLIHNQSLENDIKIECNAADDDDDDNTSDVYNDDEPKPIDLSMDALDLSKKSSGKSAESIPSEPLSMMDKNQHLFFAHQQYLSETLPKLDPAQYFQSLYRNFVFPGTGFPMPFLMQNPIIPPTNLNDVKDMMMKDVMRGQMSGGNLVFPSQPPPRVPSPTPAATKSNESPNKISTPTTIPTTPSSISSQGHNQQSPGPVKMVIKNGVLMPKQKQRRYRTERPFACEHCSARFTLRSNMERHIKQQHPQFWAQRQRSGHSILRRGNGPPSSSQLVSPIAQQVTVQNNFTSLSDQVKYAILAQQLKYNTKDMPLHQNTNNNSLNYQNNNNNNNNNNSTNSNNNNNNNQSNNSDMTPQHDEDEEDAQLVIDEDSQPEDLTQLDKKPVIPNDNVIQAKKIAENILHEARKASVQSHASTAAQAFPKLHDAINFKTEKLEEKIPANLIPKAETVSSDVGDYKDEADRDLSSVSKLVDDANLMSFGNYFPSSEPMDHSDEEGLVASGSASESNASGAEDQNSTPTEAEKPKKISAYSLAPNRVACPYCQRMFPWSSSLRRHILTHTGQKPFKCSHCPLLFTTKSNCDRHLLRKHRNFLPMASSIDVLAEAKKDRLLLGERTPPEKSSPPHTPPMRYAPSPSPLPPPTPPQLIPTSILNLKTETTTSTSAATATAPPPPMPPAATSTAATSSISLPISSELPFKCHLCDGSFSERLICLEHIKGQHPQDFSLLMAKGAIEAEPECVQSQQNGQYDEDEPRDGKGKYPDYANRKVICAFCLRRFWSTEDLRRHVRTHSGERPFKCVTCSRKFTLKHSMLRHQKKHFSKQQPNSASDLSDDEQQPPPPPPPQSTAMSFAANKLLNIPDLIPKDLALWKFSQLQHHAELNEQLGNIISSNPLFPFFQNNHRKFGGGGGSGGDGGDDENDLIGNLLGISDQGMLNRMLLSSADEAAKLLGVEK